MALNFEGLVPGVSQEDKASDRNSETTGSNPVRPSTEVKEPDEVKEGSEVIPGELTDPIVAANTLWIEEAAQKLQAFDLTEITLYFKKVDLVINKMAEDASDHKITDKESFDKAIQMGTQARKMDNELKKRVDEMKAPYLKFNRDLGSLYKKVSQKLEGIAKGLKVKVVKEKDTYMPKKAASTPPPAPAKGGSPGKPAPAPPKAVGDERVKIDGASAKNIKVPKWELDDITLVPAKYMTLNAIEINKAVKAGIREIPGLRIWEEDDLDMRYNQS